MSFRYLKIVFLFAFITLSNVVVWGQIMPANASVILTPPHPIFLSNYYAVGSNSLQTVINFTDFTEPSWDVRLRVTIESEDIKISTSANFSPAVPITLTPGLPTTIQGDDFYEYLNINNVDLQGITPASLNQNGKLPEGLYNFCVEVLDFKTGVPLSLPACNSAYLFMEQPPVVLSPECESVIIPSSPQNVFFQWQIAGGASPTIAATSKYKLSVYEVTGENTDPYFAVQNSQALLVYESDFMPQLSMALDFNTVLLVPGKKYTFRVRAVDIEEQDVYANNGYSEWCWFYYGYPSNGVLDVQSPIDEFVFGKYDQKSFSWKASTIGVANQQYDYTIIIKELNEGQTKSDAIANNPVWFEETLPPSTSAQGYTYLLNEDIGRDKKYVWQVVASTSGQEVAESEVKMFLAPPLVENFYAGNSLIKVETITNGDPNNLAGTARVMLSDQPSDYISITFDSLKIVERIGNTYLEAGHINFDLSDRDNLELTPALAENGSAEFIHESGKINKNGLKFYGSIEWGLPHAVSSGEQAIVKTQNGWFTLNDSYELNGVSYLNNENDFTLLNPLDLRLNLSSNSRIDISKNEYTLKIEGDVYLSEEVKTNGSDPYTFPFTQQAQLYYFEAEYLLSNAVGYLLPSDDLKMALMPKKAIVDLSETQSPGKLASSKYWKGVYFPEFKVRLIKSEFDASNQISLGNTFDYDEDLEASHKFWVSSQGLQLKYSFVIDEDENLKFNTFKTESINAVVNITNNELLNSSKLTGAIKLPVLDKQELFTFEVSVVETGLAEGFLDQDLTEREIIFNPFGGENRVNITINRAVFVENNCLELNIDAEIPVLGATVSNIDDFRIYGDNYIGVGARNGKFALSNYVEGMYKTYPAFIQEVGASLTNGNYAFSYVASMDLGDDVAGENGPPLLSVSSVEPAGDDVSVSSVGAPAPQIEVPDSTSGVNTLTVKDMYITVENAIVEINGYLKLRQNDPKWGTAFMGGINGKIKIPTEIQAGANMILGKKEETNFWYFDAWFNDTQGMGIPVFQAFNLVAMEGRIYRHMSKQDGEYIVDPSLDFGAGLYMQIVDQQQKGRLFVADIGAEIEVSGTNFVVAMEGDISGLNPNGRTTLTGGVVSAVGEEIVEEVINAIGPVSFDFDIAGGTLSVEAEGVESGSLNYVKGDLALGFAADLGSVPSVGFNFAKGNNSFLLNAAASGDFNLGLGIEGNEIGLGMRGRNEAYLDLSISSVELHSRVNREKRTGSLTLGIDDKLLDFGVETDGGYMNLEYDATHSFRTGFKTTGSAFLGVQYDENVFQIAGDKSEGSGSIFLNIEGVEMNTALNTTEKSAHFSLTTEGVNINANGAYQKGGSFLLALGQDSYDVAANLENSTGHIDFEFNGDKRLFAELTEDGQGALLLKNGTQEFGLSGNTAGTAGSVRYKDNTAQFTISADRIAKTGSIGLSYDENFINSAISTDSAFIALSYSGVEFETGITASGRGKVRLKEGTNELAIEGNLEDKSGLFLLTDGSNRIYAEGNSNATGKLELLYSGNEFRGGITQDSLMLYALAGGFEMDVAGDKSGNGSVSFKNGSIHTRLALDKTEQAGEIYYKNGSDIIHVAGNKTQNTGLINVDIAGIGFNAYVDDSVFLSAGPVLLKGNVEDATGFIQVKGNNEEIKLLKIASETSLNLTIDNIAISLGRNNDEENDFVSFNNGEIGVSGFRNHTGTGGGIKLDLPDLKIGVGGDYTQGSGNFEFLNSDYIFNISANAITKEAQLNFAKSGLSINANNDPENQTAYFNVGTSSDSLLSAINMATNKANISYSNADFKIGAEKENDDYKVFGKYNDHDVSVVSGASSSYLQYLGSGVSAKLGKTSTHFIIAEYSGVEVKLEDEKVFVNESEIFDYAGALPTESIDFSNFYFPSLDISSIDFTGIDLSLPNLSGVDFSGLNFNGLDLSNVDFSGLDFSRPNINLSGIDFTGVNFGNANLSGIDFTGINFGTADLSGFDFSGIQLSSLNGLNLTGLDFSGVNLSNVNISGLNLSGLNLSGVNFTGFDFSGVDLSGIDFTGINLANKDLSGLLNPNNINLKTPNVNLSSIDFTGFDFTGVNLSGVNFTGINIPNANLSGIDFTGFDFTGVDLSGVNFDGLSLAGLDLSGIDFSGFDFTGVDLSGIDFSGFNFSGANLSGVDFTGFNFNNVDLSSVNFSGFDFSGFDLSGINFSGVDFGTKDLSGIDFSGVNFSGVDLSGINFSGISLPDLPNVNWEHTEVIEDVTVKVKLAGQEYKFTILKGADSVELYTNNWVDNSVNVFIDGHFVKGSKMSDVYEVAYNDMSAKFKVSNKGMVEVKKGVDYQLKMSAEEISGKYEEHAFKLATDYTMTYNNNESEIGFVEGVFQLKHDNKQVTIGSDNFKVYYEADKHISLSSEGLEVNYQDKNLAITNGVAQYTSGDDLFKVSTSGLEVAYGDKAFELKPERFYAAIDNNKSVTYLTANNKLSVNYEDKSFSISGDKQITYNDPDRSFDLSPAGLSLAQDGRSVSISENELTIVLEDDKKLEIKDGILDATYETRNVKLGATSLFYTDGSQTVDLSQDGLSLSKDDNTIYVNKNEFGLNVGSEKHLIVNRTDQAVDFKYNDILAEFSNNESLSFSDGERSFALGTDGLEMSEGDKSIAVIADEQGQIGLRMINGEDQFFVNNKGFAIDYEGQHYAINENEYLTVNIDATNRIEVANNGGKFISGETELIIGGATNFLEVKDANRSIALTAAKSLVYEEGDYVATLTKDLEVELTDGTRSIDLFKNDKVMVYTQAGYSFGIRGGSGITPGIDISDGNNTIFVEGMPNSHATVGVESSDFGNMNFTCNSAKDIDAAYEFDGRTLTLAAGSQGVTFEDSDNVLTQEPELPPQVGTETPDMDGPQYLGDGITANAGGRVKGHASLYFNSAESHFIANASVVSSFPPCMSGSFGMEVKPGTFNFNIGSREQKIIVKPYCIGLEGNGFLEVRNSNVQFGVGIGFEARGSVDIGVADITAYAYAALEVEANIDLDPFRINEASLFAEAGAGLEVDPAGPIGSFTVASARISGRLTARFLDNKTNVSGKLDGSVTVLGISEGFSMGFNADF